MDLIMKAQYMNRRCFIKTISLTAGAIVLNPWVWAKENQSLDEKVRNFLESYRYKWRDMNISETDGKVLYDLIIKHTLAPVFPDNDLILSDSYVTV